jgi:hypothetical protein
MTDGTLRFETETQVSGAEGKKFWDPKTTEFKKKI